MSSAKTEIRSAFFHFEKHRSFYQLSPANSGFFTSFRSCNPSTDAFSEFRKQVITTLIAPLMVFCFLEQIVPLVNGASAFLVGLFLCNKHLRDKGMKAFYLALIKGIVTPIVAIIVTLASAISLITRTIGTCLSAPTRKMLDTPTDIFLNMMPSSQTNRSV